MRFRLVVCQSLLVLLAAILALHGTVLTVGPGRTYSSIEKAVRVAPAGATIDVYENPSGYDGVAVRIATPGLTIVGMGRTPVRLDGRGFDYSGVGSVPRAIFQIDPGGAGATIRNFVLTGAHNASHNGAGVRINGADRVTVEACDIVGNDMGVMSAGAGSPRADAADQTISGCHIHANGDAADPGYNHNLYLGGMSATLRRCEVDHALTGHNIKSRAHFTLVEDCYVHDSANREFDFVEAAETERPNSNAVLVNCVIDKAPNCAGNRAVIHFGREHGIRRGGLWVIHCTVLTPFASAVALLDGPETHAEFDDDIVVNSVQASPTLIEADAGASLQSVTGFANWLSTGYSLAGTRIDPRSRYAGARRTDTLGLIPPRFLPHGLPDIGTPDPAYYRDGNGKEWEVTPSATLGASLPNGV